MVIAHCFCSLHTAYTDMSFHTFVIGGSVNIFRQSGGLEAAGSSSEQRAAAETGVGAATCGVALSYTSLLLLSMLRWRCN